MSSINFVPAGGSGGSQDLQSVLTVGNVADKGFTLLQGNRSLRVSFNPTDTIISASRQNVGQSVQLSTRTLSAIRTQFWADDDGEMFLKHVNTFFQPAVVGLIVLLWTIPHGLSFTPEIVLVSFDTPDCATMVGNYALTVDATNIYLQPISSGVSFDFDLVGKFLAIK